MPCPAGSTVALLRILTGLSEDATIDALDKLLRAGLIRGTDPSTGRYDFAHVIVRHTLVADLNPDRRARLHRGISGALQTAAGGEDRVAELT
ncbi:MAG: hypothetical protein ACRD0A_20940 [Acidimicrobiales bacterium]